MDDNKNLIFAIVLSICVLWGADYFIQWLRPAPVAQTSSAEVGKVERTAPPIPSADSVSASDTVALLGSSRKSALEHEWERGARLRIETPQLTGSLNLRGAFLDDLVFKNYRETPQADSTPISLLSPTGSPQPYHAFFRWYAGDISRIEAALLPNETTLWKADKTILSPGHPVTLSWDNGQGILFQQMISVDERYMFTVTQRVTNKGNKPVALGVQGLIHRFGTPQTGGFYILHEGPLGVFDGALREVTYESLKDQLPQPQKRGAGWLGMTDKFWLMALVPQTAAPMLGNFQSFVRGGVPIYQADFRQEALTIPVGSTVETKNFLFAGAKELKTLDYYEKTYQIKNFDLAVDFGWFYPITKPIFYALGWLHDWTGNFGIALLCLTVLLKALFFPLTNRSYRSMARMRRLQPQIAQLKTRFGDDKMQFNQEMMALYRHEKINPVAGCLPMVIQIPFFFALYKVLFISIEMRQAPFFCWIQDLSAPDPTTFFNLFGLIPWTPPSMLMIGAWPMIMGLTMLVQQKLNPPPTDPVQAKMFLVVMPVVTTVVLAQFPAGLVIYWAWSNVISIGQQALMMRMAGGENKPANTTAK